MTETLELIAKEISVCKSCELWRTRTNSVPGVGPANTEIMLIGEGPGKNEDLQGLPFIGQAGKLLTELLADAGLTRDEVFVCNVVKCRPPLNRDPEPAELTACDAFLDRQIAAINPKIIITLGRFSMGKFFQGVKITQVHGKMKRVGDAFVIPMFHPAAALHQVALKPTIKQDFANLPKLLSMAKKELDHEKSPVTDPKVEPSESADLPAKQMKLL